MKTWPQVDLQYHNSLNFHSISMKTWRQVDNATNATEAAAHNDTMAVVTAITKAKATTVLNITMLNPNSAAEAANSAVTAAANSATATALAANSATNVELSGKVAANNAIKT